MTKFTTDTNVYYLDTQGRRYAAKIIAVLPECNDETIVAQVENEEGHELVLVYPDGSRDDDGNAPMLVEGKPQSKLFAAIRRPYDSQGIFRATVAEVLETGARPKKIVEVTWEGEEPVSVRLIDIPKPDTLNL